MPRSCTAVLLLAAAFALAAVVLAPSGQAECEPFLGTCPPPEPPPEGDLCYINGQFQPCPPSPP